MPYPKNLRKEAAKRKAKQKNIIIAVFCALAVVAAAVLLINSSVRQSNAETYRAGGQAVRLFNDGKFSATLAHNARKTGTYTTKTEEDGGTAVSFNMNGVVAVGRIEGNALRLPEEWDDGCGHGGVLRRR
jgi:hypothetical protein